MNFKPRPRKIQPASTATERDEDLGYGASHGYGPAHGGPSGPGDMPADVATTTPREDLPSDPAHEH